MSYVTTDRELYNIELMVKLQKLFFNCEISGWGFMLISIKDHPAISWILSSKTMSVSLPQVQFEWSLLASFLSIMTAVKRMNGLTLFIQSFMIQTVYVRSIKCQNLFCFRSVHLMISTGKSSNQTINSQTFTCPAVKITKWNKSLIIRSCA